MKFSANWLNAITSPFLSSDATPDSVAALGDRLTMAGLEVEGETTAAPAVFSGVVVAEIVGIAPHPDAERLRVCQVNVGKAELLQIVCGARNAAVGLKVPCAQVGALLPPNEKTEGKPFEIKSAKLRGVPSAGMLCGADEIGFPRVNDGLWVLPEDAPVGMELNAWLGLDDTIMELKITPNRGDALSILGLAREVLALRGQQSDQQHLIAQFFPKNISQNNIQTNINKNLKKLNININEAAQKACPQYFGRSIAGINPNAQTPMWLSETLRRSGIRSIHPVVDVTNLVLLALGQPMHAFDQSTLCGDIHVRYAESGEKLAALNQETLTLAGDDLVIADGEKALALAGIIGGAESAVNNQSVDIFLESASFLPAHQAGKARRHKLSTDSSFRFERGVDFGLPELALELATAWILEICGGSAGDVVSAGAAPAPKAVINLRRSRVDELLGFAIAEPDIKHILENLGCTIHALSLPEQTWEVLPPSWRFDLNLEVDLIEELVRVHGYAHIPSRTRSVNIPTTKINPKAQNIKNIKNILTGRDYFETISFSFIDENIAQIFGTQNALRLANPMSSKLAVMRESLFPSLIETYKHNRQRQTKRVRIFEVASTYHLDSAGNITENLTLAGLATGARCAEQWGMKEESIDFYDVKADVEAILATLGVENAVWEAATHLHLHPGQCAKIMHNGAVIGYLGKLHPQLQKSLNVNDLPFLFELTSQIFDHDKKTQVTDISIFPQIRRDLALCVESHITAQAILDVVHSANLPLLKNARVFDVYRGAGLADGQKSLAVALVFGDNTRTLTESDVDQASSTLLAQLGAQLGARLRG